MKSTLNPARTAHVHQVRHSMLQDLVDAAPIALRWNNRYVLVRPDGISRSYEMDMDNRRWALRRETPIEHAGHVELALLRSYGQRIDPDATDLPALGDDMAQQVRAWWTQGSETTVEQASSGPTPILPASIDLGILPRPADAEGAERYPTDPSLLASFSKMRMR